MKTATVSRTRSKGKHRFDCEERPHQSLYWRIDGMWAIRDGDWKLVHGQARKEPPELFDLSKDSGEKQNLATTNPEKVKELQARWDAWNAQQADPDKPKDRAAKAEKRKAKKKGGE